MKETLHVGAFSTCVCQPDKHGSTGFALVCAEAPAFRVLKRVRDAEAA